MSFAEKLKSMRKQIGMSQESLAEKIGVSRQAITKWETGVGIPDIDNLIAVSKLFDISIDELVSNERNKREAKEYQYESVTEYDIAEQKHYDMKLGVASKLYLSSYVGEKLLVRLVSNTISSIQSDYKVTIEDIKKRIDINVRTLNGISDVVSKEKLVILVFFPAKYIGKVECEVVADTIVLSSLECESIELDAKTSNLFIENVKGVVEVSSNLDMNIECNSLEGAVEINQVAATSKIVIPSDWEFTSVKKGIRTKMFFEQNGESVEAFDCPNAENYIKLSGINSELIISRTKRGE